MNFQLTGSNGFSGAQPAQQLRRRDRDRVHLGGDHRQQRAGVDHFFDVPGTYYVVVDQAGVDGGDYKLDVFTE